MRYIIGYTVRNHVLRLWSSAALKLNFRPCTQWYTAPNDNFEYRYPLIVRVGYFYVTPNCDFNRDLLPEQFSYSMNCTMYMLWGHLCFSNTYFSNLLSGILLSVCIYKQSWKQCGSWSAGFWEASWSWSSLLSKQDILISRVSMVKDYCLSDCNIEYRGSYEEGSGSVVQCLNWDQGVVGFSLKIIKTNKKWVEERDKMQGLRSIWFLFRNKFNQFNNTGARMLDSIYHMTLKLLWNHVFLCENAKILLIYMTLLYSR